MFRYGQHCYVNGLSQCSYWYETWNNRAVVIVTNGKETFPVWVDNGHVIEIKQDTISSKHMPEWARQYAVSRDWTRKYPR